MKINSIKFFRQNSADNFVWSPRSDINIIVEDDSDNIQLLLRFLPPFITRLKHISDNLPFKSHQRIESFDNLAASKAELSGIEVCFTCEPLFDGECYLNINVTGEKIDKYCDILDLEYKNLDEDKVKLLKKGLFYCSSFAETMLTKANRSWWNKPGILFFKHLFDYVLVKNHQKFSEDFLNLSKRQQVFLTTNSTTLISCAPNFCVFKESQNDFDQKTLAALAPNHGKDANYILSTFLGGWERDKRFQKKLDDISRDIDVGNFDTAHQKLDDLKKILGESDSDILGLERLFRWAKFKNGVKE